MDIQTIDPTENKLIANYSEMSETEVIKIIDDSHQAYLFWRDLSIDQRAIPMRKMAELLRTRQPELARLITSEMGKPITQSMAEIEKCAVCCLHYADYSAEYLQSYAIQTNLKKSFVTHEPLGLVFGIMPWNFPFWQVFRFAVPTMMAGNGALLKHAPISTGTALTIEKLFKDAGFPDNLFRSLILSNEASANVMAHPHVAAVTFTGSVGAGRIIAAEAGKALKKTVLELGGCDGYVVLADADLDQAAEACVTSRLLNAGQSCIAAKRLVVDASVEESFVELLRQKMKKFVMGNPLKETTTMGPLARKDLRDKVHAQVELCVAQGAALLEGGYIPELPGFYYPPTLLTKVAAGMPAYEEEIFGPVLTVITAKDEDHAIKIANQTNYGLGAAVFTKDIQRGEIIASKKLQAGTCVVNTFVVSDSRLPFGGIKHSGYGRELAQEGILSFVNTKTVNVVN